MNTQDEIRMQSHKDPAQLEREIDAQRSHIEQLVGALENKLSPSEMLDRVMSFGKGSGKDFAGNLMDTVKANPVPALLTAAGMLWLYSGRDRDPSAHRSLSGGGYGHYGIGSRNPAPRGAVVGAAYVEVDEYGIGGDGSSSGGRLDAARDKLGDAKDRLGSMKDHTKDRLGDMKDHTKHRLGSMKDHVSDSASHAAGSVRQRAGQGAEWFQRLMHENPMGAAAIAIGAGALLGSLLPETRKEHELMGEASDRMTDKVKDMAHTGGEKLADAGHELADAGREVTRPQSDKSTGTQTGASMGASGAGRSGPGAGTGAGTGTTGGTGSGYTPSRPH